MDAILQHRSIRKFKPSAVGKALLEDLLLAGTRAANTGNMQAYSMVVTTAPLLLERLAPCHFNQPAAKAPVQITFCVDYNRLVKWCLQRNARPGFGNLLSFLAGYGDAFLAAQNVCLAAEEKGLGTCFLGTTLYSARQVSEILQLPKGVIPILTLVVGYPDEQPGLTDRLPPEGVVHWQIYSDYSPEDIDRIYREKEASPLTKHLLEVNGKETLAQIFTDNRYPKEMNESISVALTALLREQGFLT